MFDIGIDNLIWLVIGIVIAWYARGFYGWLKVRLDRRAAEAAEALNEEKRKELLRLIDLAILNENKAFEIAETMLDLGRKRKHRPQGGALWDLMRSMRNNINEYSGHCGRIEDLDEHGIGWQRMVTRRRRGTDPFAPKPETKRADKPALQTPAT